MRGNRASPPPAGGEATLLALRLLALAEAGLLTRTPLEVLLRR